MSATLGPLHDPCLSDAWFRAVADDSADVRAVKPYVADPDFTLLVGDVRDCLRDLPAGSVDCCVTSPPYWGLRDYGTGSWDGGDPDCDHLGPPKASERSGLKNDGRPPECVGQNDYERAATVPFRAVCGKCGATRVDNQIGLEPTPEAFVAALVEVFREVRRVLADHGTCWVNLGDSYNANGREGHGTRIGAKQGTNRASAIGADSNRPTDPALKPKDLVGIPWRVAFALQADGWYLRSDIIWSKPNPMPESVTDRPTKAHEYVFLLSKGPRYFFDQEAVREPHSPDGRKKTVHDHLTDASHPNYDNVGNGNERWPNGGRNIRSVWEIATQPYAEAHFATFSQELPRRCILAGCPEWVCRVCEKPRERIVEVPQADKPDPNAAKAHGGIGNNLGGGRHQAWGNANPAQTLGWSDCGHDDYRLGVVLDPFLGSGTTAYVARTLGRRSVGIELNEEYAQLAARRLQQQSLFAGDAA